MSLQNLLFVAVDQVFAVDQVLHVTYIGHVKQTYINPFIFDLNLLIVQH